MKICYFIDVLNRAGKERQFLELCKGLLEKSIITKDEILIISFQKNGEMDDEFRKLGIGLSYVVRKSKKDFGVLFRLIKIVKKFKPDIIHVWDKMTLFYGLVTAKYLNIKFINGSIRAATPLYQLRFIMRLLIKIGVKFADINISNSVIGLHIQGLSLSEKNYAILNGFDFRRVAEVKPKELILRELGVDTKFVVGMVALFAERKDYGTFIKAAETVLRSGLDVTFLCVGDGPKLDFFKSSVNPKYKDNFRFLGHQGDVESIVNTFDIGVLTSNTDRGGEGISNSIMEYMALAKPAIATDSGGNKELIVDQKTGYIIHSFDDKKLSELIITLLNEPVKKEAIGIEGKTRIMNEFSMGKMVANYSNLYVKIID